MKINLIILILVFIIGCDTSRHAIHSPYISDNELSKLDDALQKEDWPAVASLSSYYIKLLKRDSTSLRSQMEYVFLLASAAKVATGLMEYPELHEVLKDYEGKYLTLPMNKVSAKCGPCFNYYGPSSNNKDIVFTTATDRRGLYIFCWVYGKIEERFDASGNEGNWAYLQGTVKSIDYNPNQSRIWVLRVTLEPAKLIYQ